MQIFSIETPNLILRQYLPSDAKDVSFYSQQPKVAYWMSDMVMHNHIRGTFMDKLDK